MGPNASPRAVAAAIETMARLRPENYLKTLATTISEPMAGNLRAILAPTHVIVGEHDALTPPAISAKMAAEIPGAALSVIPNAGHLSNIEAPDELNRVAFDFLRGLSSN